MCNNVNGINFRILINSYNYNNYNNYYCYHNYVVIIIKLAVNRLSMAIIYCGCTSKK